MEQLRVYVGLRQTLVQWYITNDHMKKIKQFQRKKTRFLYPELTFDSKIFIKDDKSSMLHPNNPTNFNSGRVKGVNINKLRGTWMSIAHLNLMKAYTFVDAIAHTDFTEFLLHWNKHATTNFREGHH